VVGRGSGIAEGGRSAQCRPVGIWYASPESCRAVCCATHGSAAIRRCVRFTNEMSFRSPMPLLLFRSLAPPTHTSLPLCVLLRLFCLYLCAPLRLCVRFSVFVSFVIFCVNRFLYSRSARRSGSVNATFLKVSSIAVAFWRYRRALSKSPSWA
jgi:hypothetical protein